MSYADYSIDGDHTDFRKIINAKNKTVLLISDMHCPYSHPDAFKFLKAIKKKYKPQVVVNLGDEVDGHAISFHKSESELLSAGNELKSAILQMDLLGDLFPKMYLCESNHGSLIYRRLKAEGIPVRHLKPLSELYNNPSWEWYHEIILQTKLGDVLCVHGKTGSYNKLASEQGISAVQGHFHSRFEITWQASTTNIRFNMIAGCLIDHKSLAFAYGKNIAKKPILGLGMIDKSGEPTLIRMNLDEKGRWDGKL